ncbi:MAG: hypothetical protein ACYC7B_05415 [Burkholderiales bacterium]
MRNTASTRLPASQRGIALLILLSIIGMAIIFALVAGLNKSANDLARARDLKTYAALAQAKAALINYAVTYKDTHDNPGSSKYYVPGYLPCPDLGSSTYEGQAASNCPLSGPTALVSVIGRLPWRTLGLDALKDGSGECLWYAVSGTYKNDPNNKVSGSTTTSNMMNWDTNGQFAVVDSNGNTLAGSSPDNEAVAVIFAPGSALIPAGASAVQDRTPAPGTTNCGGNYIASSYLESAIDGNNIVRNNSTLVTPSSPPSVADTSTFIAGTASSTFNDKLVYITRADIWNAIKKRTDFNNYLRAMTRLAAECTATYGQYNWNGSGDVRLPWASSVSLSGISVPTYAVDARYNDVSGVLAGRLAYRVDDSASWTNNVLPWWYNSNGYIFYNNSYCSYSPDQQVWYDNWKDQLFYAVASNFQPWSGNIGNCPTCLKVNGSGTYAAVVIFAGDKLTNAAGQVIQPRNTASDKGTIANYLDGSTNPASIAAGTGGGNYQAAAASSTFNDIVYAIDANLAVKCYNPSTGMMVTPTTTNIVAPPGTGNAGVYNTDLKNYAACP